MRKKDHSWPPGHSITKGYPYDFPVTQDTHPLRPSFEDVESNGENILKVTFDGSTRCFARGSFVANLVTYLDSALRESETQVKNILDEYPFIPEEFGFEKVHSPKSIKDIPAFVWQSVYNSELYMHRKDGGVGDDNRSNYSWVIMKRNEDGTISSFEVYLPCHRIAYAFFIAANIVIEREDRAVDGPVQEQAPDAPAQG